MADALYGWMQNLAFFFILMTAVLNCIPDGQYRKYVRFFLGLVLLIVLSGPLLKLFSLDEILSSGLSRAVLEQEAMDAGNMQITVEGLQEEYLLEAYEQELESQIAVLLEERGIGVRSVAVQIGAKKEGLSGRTGDSAGTERAQGSGSAQETGGPAVEEITLTVYNRERSLYESEQQALDRAFAAEVEEIAEELSGAYRVEREHINVKQE